MHLQSMQQQRHYVFAVYMPASVPFVLLSHAMDISFALIITFWLKLEQERGSMIGRLVESMSAGVLP